MTAFVLLAAGALWGASSVIVAIIFCRGIRLGGDAVDDATWLDDQPAECLADAEVERRFAEIAARTERVWWA